MKCKLCGKKIKKDEEYFCCTCKKFLKWKYKDEIYERIKHQDDK